MINLKELSISDFMALYKMTEETLPNSIKYPTPYEKKQVESYLERQPSFKPYYNLFLKLKKERVRRLNEYSESL